MASASDTRLLKLWQLYHVSDRGLKLIVVIIYWPHLLIGELLYYTHYFIFNLSCTILFASTYFYHQQCISDNVQVLWVLTVMKLLNNSLYFRFISLGLSFVYTASKQLIDYNNFLFQLIFIFHNNRWTSIYGHTHFGDTKNEIFLYLTLAMVVRCEQIKSVQT